MANDKAVSEPVDRRGKSASRSKSIILLSENALAEGD